MRSVNFFCACWAKFLLLSCLFSFSIPLQGQMWNGQDTLAGNEWLAYERDYIRMGVHSDGLYRVFVDELIQAGFPEGTVAGASLRLYYFGAEVPLYVSDPGILEGTDWIEFRGYRNRAELDRYLFTNPDEELLNPAYSMFSDTAFFFLSWELQGGDSLRYRDLANDFSDLPPAESWCWTSQALVFSDQHQEKRYDSQHLIALSEFDEGEGFGSMHQQQHEMLFQLSNWWKDDPAAQVTLRLVSDRSNLTNDHHLRVSVKGATYLEAFPPPYSIIQADFVVNPDAVSKSLPVLVEGLFDNQDRYSVSYCQVDYRRDFDFSNQATLFFSLDGSSTKKYLEIKTGATTPILFDFSRGARQKPELTGGKARFSLEPFAGIREFCFADSITGFLKPSYLSKVRFQELVEDETSFILITPAAFHSEAMGPDNISAYASYRESSVGGGYRVAIVEIEDIYNQFGYGISGHPQAIRNFGYYLRRRGVDIQYILLVGHGLVYPLVRQGGSDQVALHHIPCFGHPGSDNLLFSDNGAVTPGFPVGRIAAREASEVKQYLDKVQEHELGLQVGQTISQQQWRQRVLHLVGGSASEQAGFSIYLNSLKKEIEGNGYGGMVLTVTKESNEPVQTSGSDQVIRAMNEGVGIKTFLGHGGVTNTDFGLDDPALFSNEGRYPLIFSLGCLSGNLFDLQNSLSERFVLAPRGGSIGYVASSGFAYPNALEAFTRKFYELAGGTFYNAGLGDIMREVRNELSTNVSLSFRSLLQQFIFHGDPAIRLRGEPFPDLIPDISSVAFTPSPIDARQDSFSVQYNIANIGRSISDTVLVQVKRLVGSSILQEFTRTVELKGALTADQMMFPVLADKAKGQNTLWLEVDSDNFIVEAPQPAAEWNNRLVQANGNEGMEFYILDEQPYPVYPQAFALIDQPSPVLKAYTSGKAGPVRRYRFELDTTLLFNSGALRIHEENLAGPLLPWKLHEALPEGKVCYWRVSLVPEESPDQQYNWQSSSFLYLSGQGKGWNQSHAGQFRQNELDRLVVDSLSGSLTFARTSSSVIGEAMALTSQNNALSRILLNNNRIFRAPVWWGKNLNIAVFDPQTGNNLVNPPGGALGAWNLSAEDLNAFVFKLDSPEERKKIIDFLLGAIPDGHYVLLFTNHLEGADFQPETWALDSVQYGVNLFQVLESAGASQVRLLEDKGSVPYIFAYVKGQEVLGEKISDGLHTPVSLVFSLPGSWASGQMHSGRIGPAKNWGEVIWEGVAGSPPEKEEVQLLVYGVAPDGQTREKLLEKKAFGRFSLEHISPPDFPWLELEWEATDSSDRTCPSFGFWRVTYQGVGDVAVRSVTENQVSNDTVSAGSSKRVEVVMENIGDFGLDSLWVGMRIENEESNFLVDNLTLEKPLAPADTVHIGVSLDTRTLDGHVQVLLEGNPGRAQPELHYFNNIWIKDLYVQTDDYAPFLEVTFDGRRILNGELVSARPVIAINLRDENPYLSLQDTASIQVQLVHPDGTLKKFSTLDPEVTFFPSQKGEDNQAQLIIEPAFTDDGMYTLRVQGRDAQGNFSGKLDYQVAFKIIRKRSISSLLPYPNPFSSRCRFVYTLTGDRTPSLFRVQILTLSGKVVKEISQDEFGPLSIGTHLSDYYWDGTDMYGDKLANGVYLYRVLASDAEGGQLDRYKDDRIDSFFDKEMGKIVIIR